MLNIERILKDKGMTQQDLADRLGVSVPAVNSVICGRRIPSESLLKKYAEVLDVEKDDLYDGFLY